jgi:hypothetical protein
MEQTPEIEGNMVAVNDNLNAVQVLSRLRGLAELLKL